MRLPVLFAQGHLEQLKTVVADDLDRQVRPNRDNGELLAKIEAVEKCSTWDELETLATVQTLAAVVNRCMPNEL
jgi:hypothetical protein